MSASSALAEFHQPVVLHVPLSGTYHCWRATTAASAVFRYPIDTLEATVCSGKDGDSVRMSARTAFPAEGRSWGAGRHHTVVQAIANGRAAEAKFDDLT